jgi:glyoxylase-like metal-dependent hydrolase (beta-lactamase superfamily II)
MEITPFYESGSGTWSYLLADTEQNKAAIIDPVMIFDPVSGLCDSSAVDPLLTRARQKAYSIEWVLETHIHADHLSAARYVCQETGAKLAAGHAVPLVQSTFARVFNLQGFACDGRQFDRLLADGAELQLGGLTIRVLETPGHTPDSISFLVGDAAFIGDTLFSPALGSARCDFPGGSARKLYESVEKLHALPAHTNLYLCHDYPAAGADPVSHVSVAESRQKNAHLNSTVSVEDFVELRQSRDATLPLPRLILPSVQINIHGRAALSAEANGIAYLKTPLNKSIRDILASSG